MAVSNGIFDQGPGGRQETDMFRPGRFLNAVKSRDVILDGGRWKASKVGFI